MYFNLTIYDKSLKVGVNYCFIYFQDIYYIDYIKVILKILLNRYDLRDNMIFGGYLV